MEQSSLSEAKTFFHRLKGSAGNSGVMSIYYLCIKAEEQLEKPDWKGVKESYRSISQILEKLKERHFLK